MYVLTGSSRFYGVRGCVYLLSRISLSWIHGRIGNKQRRELPACVVGAIRSTYPVQDEPNYTGFADASPDEYSISEDEEGTDTAVTSVPDS